MLEKDLRFVSTMLGNERGRDFLSEVIDIMRDKVGHPAIFAMAPAMVNHITDL
jgi:hypothetical protein